jgi:polyisoprenoid-binding protein YceI
MCVRYRSPLAGLLLLAPSLALLSCPQRLWGEPKPSTPAGAYRVDTRASRVYIKVGSATRVGHHHGVEGKLKSGRVVFGGKGELVIDTTSFRADTAAARRRAGLDPEFKPSEARQVTATMRGGRILDVAQFPTATYRIDAITPLDGQAEGAAGTYRLAGRFTLHGVERKLRFKAKVGPADQEARSLPGALLLSGSFTVRQSDYGIKPYAALGGVVRVADELRIWGDVVLIPSPPR